MMPRQRDSGLTMRDVDPSRCLRIWGMRRSGNHAIINWIMRNGPAGGTIFFNNCHPKRDPLKTMARAEVYFDGVEINTDRVPARGKIDLAGENPMVILSYEDAMPREDGVEPVWDVPETRAIIYRGFLNWSASLLRKIMLNPAYSSVARARIMSAAILTYRIALDRVTEAAAVPLLYDRWTTEPDYRADLLDRLDLPQRDNGLGEVQGYGGGSSFQKDAAAASELDTLSRADAMASEPEYQILLWLAAHDSDLMERIAMHFPADAQRLLTLAETAKLWVALPPEPTPEAAQ